MFCIFQMQIIGCIYCAVVIICSGAFTYAVPISAKKIDDNTVDVKSGVKEIPNKVWIKPEEKRIFL